MAFIPNDEQQLFIDTKKKNVLVSASAGSGKTTTMVHKLVDIICNDRVPVSKLLIVTYTNAAASEMKQKIYNALLERLRSIENDEKLQEFLYQELESISVADIGTLHSVCKKILAKYFYKLNQNPSFGLIIDKEQEYLFSSTIDKVVKNRILNVDDKFYDLYENFSQKRNTSVMYSVISRIYTFLITKPDYKSWVRDMYSSCYVDIDSNVCAKFILDYYKEIVGAERKTLWDYLMIAESSGLDKFSEYIKSCICFIDEFSATSTYMDAAILVNSYKFQSKPAVRQDSKDVDMVDFNDRFTPVAESFKNIVSKELKKYFYSDSKEDIDRDIARTREVLDALIDIVYEVMDEYATSKKNLGVLDFNDLEHKTLQLLDFVDVRDDLSSNYEYVFVDEYQDINEMQECIISKLVSGTNLNMIGDVKQSIYGFRLSTPKIFIDKYNAYKLDNKDSLAIDLNFNYRSDLNILEFVNFVCDSIITLDTIGVDYKATARLQTKATASMSNKPVVRLNIIDNEVPLDDEEVVDDILDDGKIDILQAEANLVLSEIDRIISSETLVEKDVTRNYHYEDIAILVRNKTDLVKTIIDVLSLHQIPVNVSVNSEFFDTYEVSVLVAILKVIANYKDDISLVSVLKSPLFRLTDEDLVDIRLSNPKAKYYYEAIESYDRDDNIGTTIAKLFDFITKYNNYLIDHTLYELMNDILIEYDLICYFKSMPDGDIKEINIAEFVGLLDNENYKYDIHKFLSYLRFIDKDKYSKKLGDGKGVSIYTIHYSKGLEYPAVILAGLGNKFNLNKDTSNVIINDAYGVGIKAIDLVNRKSSSTLIVDACKLANKKSEIDEEIRLLYVAMTRARNILSLIGRYKVAGIEKSASSSVYTSRNYLDFIFKALSKLDVGQFTNKYVGDNVSFTINQNKPSNAECYVYSFSGTSNDFVDVDKTIRVQKVVGKEIDEIMSMTSVVNRPSIAIKNTVTKMLMEENEYNNYTSAPQKLDITDSLDSSDALVLGTAYHSIMQSVNYGETREEISTLIDTLYSNGTIPKEVTIDSEEIYSAVKIVGKMIADNKIMKEKQFIFRDKHCNLVKDSDTKDYVIVQGVIDLAIITKDGAIILDYKTNKSSVDFMKSHYKLQLDLYKNAFEKAYKTKVIKKYLYSFKHGKLIEID